MACSKSALACPLLARNGHAGAVRRRLLLRVERTCRSSWPTSEFDPLTDSAVMPRSSILATRGSATARLRTPASHYHVRLIALEHVMMICAPQPFDYCFGMLPYPAKLTRQWPSSSRRIISSQLPCTLCFVPSLLITVTSYEPVVHAVLSPVMCTSLGVLK